MAEIIAYIVVGILLAFLGGIALSGVFIAVGAVLLGVVTPILNAIAWVGKPRN